MFADCNFQGNPARRDQLEGIEEAHDGRVKKIGKNRFVG